jgi:nucleotide-binding universal stress UspA family protein
MNEVVVGVDGSVGASAALALAAHEAALRGATLRIVCAWGVAQHADPVPHADGERILHSWAHNVCEDALAEAKRLEPSVRCEICAEEGDPRVVLVDEARDAALLVVGSRGLGGFKSLLLGSVGQECVRHASCPVLVVPATAPTAATS